MRELLKSMMGKTLRLYSVSGVESYLGKVTKVEEEYLVLADFFKKEETYIALKYVESFKEEKGK